MHSVKSYKIFDLVIESNISFPELPEADSEIPACKFELLPAADTFAEEFDWFDHWQFRDGWPWLSFAIHEGQYLLRFSKQGDFWVSGDGKEVRCRPLPNTPILAIRHLFLNQVFPLILSRQERLVLHASAVVLGHRAIAFLGPSGQGKSTLAAAFGDIGCPVIADDSLVLRDTPDGWMAIPSYPGVRLWPECSLEIFGSSPVTTEGAPNAFKRRVSDPGKIPFAEKPSLARCLYFIDCDEEEQSTPSIIRLPPHEIFVKLSIYSFNIKLFDKQSLRSQFETVAEITATVPCFDLRYPRNFSSLSLVRDVVITHQRQQVAKCDRSEQCPDHFG